MIEHRLGNIFISFDHSIGILSLYCNGKWADFEWFGGREYKLSQISMSHNPLAERFCNEILTNSKIDTRTIIFSEEDIIMIKLQSGLEIVHDKE